MVKLEQQRVAELRMQQEIAAKAEAALANEEQFSNVQQEVEMKTKKLKKLWTKFQDAETTLKEEREAFQAEKADMLDTIRELGRQLKLKSLVLSNFVPPDGAELIEQRAVWNDEREDWDLPRLEIAGNTVRPRRPVSAAGLRRPETEYARQRKGFDPSARYKADNVLGAELDPHEKGTEEYQGAGMVSKHVGILTANLHVDDDELVPFQAAPEQSPYGHYPGTEDDRKAGRSSSDKSRKGSGGSVSGKSRSGKSSSHRPSTASRSRRDDE
jgi:kinesin family protein 3/17